MGETRAPFVVVGVTASIAAYTAADLVSKLVKRGCFPNALAQSRRDRRGECAERLEAGPH
jgi:hypothetical protein